MMIVKNEFGVDIDFDAAVALMDGDLREEIAGAVDTEQEFFDAYCKAHEYKYGAEFECAKENPCW